MSLIQIPDRSWKELDGDQTPSSIRTFRGVWTNDPFGAEAGYGVRVENLTSSSFPALEVRPGLDTIATAPEGEVEFLAPFLSNAILVIASDIFRVVGRYGGLESPIYTHSDGSFVWAATYFSGQTDKRLMFLSSGRGPLVLLDYSLYPYTVSTVTEAPSGMSYVTSYANRLFGRTGTAGTRVKFSALNKYDDWTTAQDAGEIVVPTPKGRPITALVSGSDRLLVMTETSIHELYGYGPQTFRLRTVTDQVGCASHNSCCLIDGVLYWLAPTGVYRYQPGAIAPEKAFSLPVQGLIDRIWPSSSYMATTDGTRYYLAVELPPDGSESGVLEYDPRFDVWTIWKVGGSISSITSLDDRVYIGLDDGRILMSQARPFSVGTDDGVPVSWVWESPPIGSGSFTTRKRWYDLWVVADVPPGSSVSVAVSPSVLGDENWVPVKSVTTSDALKSVRIVLPIEPIANANWIRIRLSGQGPVKIYEVAFRERVLPW